MFLALQTDSARLITFCGAGGNEVVSLKGVEDGWHNLSHHARIPQKSNNFRSSNAKRFEHSEE